MSKKIEFEKSSGNVFKDLDLPDADALFLGKRQIGFEVFQIIEDRHAERHPSGSGENSRR